MVDAGSHIGQMEIGAEGSTSDGSIEGSGSDGSRYGMDQHTNSLKTLLIGIGVLSLQCEREGSRWSPPANPACAQRVVRRHHH